MYQLLQVHDCQVFHFKLFIQYISENYITKNSQGKISRLRMNIKQLNNFKLKRKPRICSQLRENKIILDILIKGYC